METLNNSIILAKTPKPIHKGQFYGVFSNGGEININDQFGIRISKLGDGTFFHLKLIVYGEKPAYKINKFVKVVKQVEKVEVYKNPKKEDYELEVNKEVGLFDDFLKEE